MSKKILIVDDEPNIVISLEFLMKKEGFTVAVAVDGEEALAKVASFEPDLILLDVMMPKKSGFEVCEALRADPARRGDRRLCRRTRRGRRDLTIRGKPTR